MKNLRGFLALLTAVVFISCGNEKKDQEKITIGEEGTIEQMDTRDASANDNMSADGDNVTQEDGVVKVNLTGNDQMQFNLKEIKVKAGETVKLTLTHVGKLPVEAMGHNFVLLQKGTDVADFGQKAAAASDNQYIPKGTKAVIVHTEMIGGGQETTIEFTAPEAGTYDYICSFPGHYVQMSGKLIVE